VIRVATFLLQHRHTAAECATAFAAWNGFKSPLRGRFAHSTCLVGGHAVWWIVEAADRESALSLLPSFVARRASATEVREVRIP
jgi:hypothetical protein